MPHAGGLYYEIHGREDAPTVILSPGLGGSAQYWKPNLAAFADRFRVVLYDHRGTARSDRSLPDRTSVEDWADDLVQLMDGAGLERASLVGHAAGGLAGLALALKAPARLERLVVVNGWARLDPYTRRCFEVRLALVRDSGIDAYLRAQPIFLYPSVWASTHGERLDSEAAHQRADFPGEETVRKRVEALIEFDLRDRLGEITNPVLVLSTADDQLVPAHQGVDLADRLPNSFWSLQPRGGHAGNVTEPEDFHDRVLPWLAGEPSTKE
jgi:aminoacrylate hydrolase